MFGDTFELQSLHLNPYRPGADFTNITFLRLSLNQSQT